MLIVNQRAGFGAGRLAPPTMTYINSDADTVNRTTYTFSSKSFGVADSGRLIAVAIGGWEGVSSRTISSVTIGGVSASFVQSSSAAGVVAGVAYANVPTGTTGDIVVTFSGTMGDCTVNWWRIVDLVSLTPYDTDTGTTSLSLNFDADGVGVAAASNDSATAFTWTGATERYDTNGHTAADHTDTGSGETGRTIDANSSGLEQQAGASWR